MTIACDEQETTIQYSRNGNGCVIWTSDSTQITRLDKLVSTSEHYTLKETGASQGETVSKTYLLDDKGLISFKPAKRKMNLTDEQRKKIADRLNNAK